MRTRDLLLPTRLSIVFSSRQCQTPKNKTPIAPWRMLKTRSNAPLTLTTTKSFIISVFFFRKVFLRRDHVRVLCSMFIFGVRIGNLHTSLRTQLASSLGYSRRRLFLSRGQLGWNRNEAKCEIGLDGVFDERAHRAIEDNAKKCIRRRRNLCKVFWTICCGSYGLTQRYFS